MLNLSLDFLEDEKPIPIRGTFVVKFTGNFIRHRNNRSSKFYKDSTVVSAHAYGFVVVVSDRVMFGKKKTRVW